MNRGRIAITTDLLLQLLREPVPDGVKACGDKIPADTAIVDTYLAGDCLYLVIESAEALPPIVSLRSERATESQPEAALAV